MERRTYRKTEMKIFEGNNGTIVTGVINGKRAVYTAKGRPSDYDDGLSARRRLYEGLKREAEEEERIISNAEKWTTRKARACMFS